MQTIVLSVIAFLLVFIAMAVGVILSNKPIKGSCGGIGALFGYTGCMFCDKKKTGKCKKSAGHAQPQ